MVEMIFVENTSKLDSKHSSRLFSKTFAKFDRKTLKMGEKYAGASGPVCLKYLVSLEKKLNWFSFQTLSIM